MRAILTTVAVLLVASTGAAGIAFVSPQEGAQAIGPQLVEITTTTANVDRVEFYVDGVLAGVARTAPFRIAFDFGTELEPRTIVAKVLSNGYRTSEQAAVTTAALTAGESIAVDLVEVPLRIRSSKTVTAADMRVSENAVPQTIREILPQRGAAHFAFVVDRSLSMANGRLEAALRAVDEAMTMLRPGDTASLVLFNHTVSKARPIDRAHPAAGSARLVASGGTSLRDAVSSIPTGRRTYAVVITDGGDRNSATSEEAALRKVSSTKTVVTAAVFGSRSSFLEKAARNTGGRTRSATRANVGRVIHDILADINSRYTLIYQSHGTARGWRSIDVAALRRGVEISDSRKGYFAE